MKAVTLLFLLLICSHLIFSEDNDFEIKLSTTASAFQKHNHIQFKAAEDDKDPTSTPQVCRL